MSQTAVQSDVELFRRSILEGIPDQLPGLKDLDPSVPHAPKRKDILSNDEKKLALRNALRYFPKEQHAELVPEFVAELKTFLVAL